MKLMAVQFKRLSSRLLVTQILISFLVSFILGISTLTLTRAYFLASLEDAMDAQAKLISEALFTDGTIITEINPDQNAFNTVQQQVGNLSVEIQTMTSDPLPESGIGSEAPPEILAFEAIDLAISLVSLDGQVLIEPTRQDLPDGFGNTEMIQQALLGKAEGKVLKGSPSSWIAKSYVVTREAVPQGTLTLGQPLDALQEILLDLGWRIGIAVLVALTIATTFSVLTARGLLSPIRALAEASRGIPEGRFDEPLPTERQDELGELSRTFEEMRAQLSALEEMRTRFISDVSHELRTPLTAIKGLAETLQDGAVEDPAVRDRFLASMEQETDRLIRMTQDLLTLTRLDGDDLRLDVQNLEMRTVLEKSLLVLSTNLQARGIDVQIEDLSDHCRLEADEDRVIQILFNLLDNAVQHSPPESIIKIQLYAGSPRDPSIARTLGYLQPYSGHRPAVETLAQDSRWVIICIQDEGSGIEPKNIHQVFQRFYRADRSRTRISGGTGLGLPIALGLAIAHHGYIWLHSPAPGIEMDENPGVLAILMLPALN